MEQRFVSVSNRHPRASGGPALPTSQERAGFPLPRMTRRDPRRLLGLGLQALARNLLSGRAAAEALVRALRRGVRHRRDQRQLLPAAAGLDLRRLAREGAAGLPLRGQGQPLHHPHEEAARLRGARSTGSSTWRGRSGTSSVLCSTSCRRAFIRTSSDSIPSCRWLPQRPRAGRRVPPQELVRRRRTCAARPLRRRLRRPRSQGAGLPALGERPNRLRPLPRRRRQILGPLFRRGAARMDRLDRRAARPRSERLVLFQQRHPRPCHRGCANVEVDGRPDALADWQFGQSQAHCSAWPTSNRRLITSRRRRSRSSGRTCVRGVGRRIGDTLDANAAAVAAVLERRGSRSSSTSATPSSIAETCRANVRQDRRGQLPLAACTRRRNTRTSAPATAAISTLTTR